TSGSDFERKKDEQGEGELSYVGEDTNADCEGSIGAASKDTNECGAKKALREASDAENTTLERQSAALNRAVKGDTYKSALDEEMKGNDGTVISAEDTATTADVVQQLSAVVAGMQTRVGKHGYYRGRRATVISCSGWNADKDGTQRRRAPLPIKWRRSHRCRRSTAGTRVNAGPSRVERSGEYGNWQQVAANVRPSPQDAVRLAPFPCSQEDDAEYIAGEGTKSSARKDARTLAIFPRLTERSVMTAKKNDVYVRKVAIIEIGIDKKTVTIVENAKNSMAVPDERHLGKQEVVALSYQTTISRTILLATMTQARWQSTQ
ncbi:hypothetical protein GN958_ATG23332, partial [Phytophthora infestans]